MNNNYRKSKKTIHTLLLTIIILTGLITTVPSTSAANNSIVNGYIYDAETSMPIPNAEISLLDFMGEYDSITFTDITGFYSFNDVPSGEMFFLSVSAEGYIENSVDMPFEVGENDTVQIDLYLDPDEEVVENSIINGFITDNETGLPIEGASVSLLHWDYFGQDKITSSDPTGFYSLTTAAGAISLIFDADGYKSFSILELIINDGETKEININLKVDQDPPEPIDDNPYYPSPATPSAPVNNKPDNPETPDGVIAGFVNINYTYSTKTSDPDNDKVYYMFNWGDGNDSGWVGPYDSEKTINQTYGWNNSGLFNVTVKAKDDEDEESDWSDVLQVLIISGADLPPNTPEQITGPTLGDINTTYNFTAVTTDPENHTITYEIDWGDNSTYTSDTVSSGTQINASHKWLNEGNYLVKVRAFDIFDSYSGWSTPLVFIIDLTKPVINITNPVDNENITDIINVSANVSDLNLVRVTFELINETECVVAQVNFTSGPFSWKNNTDLYAAGNYTLRVTAYDVAGNVEYASVKIVIPEKPKSSGSPGFEVLILMVAIVISVAFVRSRHKKS